MENKIVGYLLVVVGVVIISLTALNVFNVISKKAEPISFTKSESFFEEAKGSGTSALSMLNISSKEIIYLINLSLHILLAGFFINVGFRLASLGVMLARPIIVDLQTKPSKLPPNPTST